MKVTDQSVLNNERFGVSPYKWLEYRSADGLITIVINRPPHNVLDIAVMTEPSRGVGAARDESAKNKAMEFS